MSDATYLFTYSSAGLTNKKPHIVNMSSLEMVSMDAGYVFIYCLYTDVLL